ncbi:MAG: helix-turn-helix domain-containing protein [Acidimicrobiia bacterium]|nr:helix-turn-helix domain-containing protein [Acidimicrobiia bacterium]
MSTIRSERLLRPREVAALFHVSVKTVGRWARAGELPHVLTIGGHRRFRATEIEQMLRGASRGSNP